MKKIITLLCSLLIVPQFALAQKLEASSIQDLVYEVEAANFQYKEKGLVFGFTSIQSCLYVSEDIVILKNYCFPARKYAARGIVVISKKLGMIDLYEEQINSDILKKEIQIAEFPEYLAPYLSIPFPQMNISVINSIYEKLYRKLNPMCLSTNFSFYSGLPEVNCHPGTENILNFAAWSKETQEITADTKSWAALIDAINSKL